MSLFLGPIHHWLYHKIQLQQELVDDIMTLGREKWHLPLFAVCESLYGELERGALENVIDGSNIHGWLQEQVSRVEYYLAHSVTAILDADTEALGELTTLFEAKGRENASMLGENLNAEMLFKIMSDTWLDGMPCDHAMAVLEQSENQVVWQKYKCTHMSYWQEAQGDVKYYNQLREAWIKAFVEVAGYSFEKRSEDVYAIYLKKDSLDCIDLMIEEHEHIRRLLKVMRKACSNLLKGEEIIYEDFETFIDFIRTYADGHHHGKEEKFLFNEMEAHLGALGEKLIRNGMYVEHDLGRLYVKDLEAALESMQAGYEESKLDVIAHAIGYTHLLERHIAKENEVIYTFARRQLSKEVLDAIEEKAVAFEREREIEGVQRKYLGILENLEKKYNV